MKNTIILAMLLYCSAIFSQQAVTKDNTKSIDVLLNNKLSTYNPIKALQLCKQAAKNGDAKAMNAIGVIYSKGLADTIDYKLALHWFTKATEYGYANAWTNLGLLYKDGLGVKQDFVKSYEYFSTGAELGLATCIYSKGYLLYKGLGCVQSYEKAVQLFKSAIKQGELGSMYMLGLCFRNGYGITQNTDSARYWLQKSSDAGYRFATDELLAKNPENTNIENKAQRAGAKNKQGLTAYKKMKHDISQNNIEGEYAGYAIKYDWSGQYVISKSTLKLTISRKDSLLTGVWLEDDSVKSELSAILLDSMVVFNNTEYSKQDHYNQKSFNNFQFRNASLQLVQLKDSMYMAGNIQLYSRTYGEPEKPMYIALSRVSDKLRNLDKSNTLAVDKEKAPIGLNIDSGNIDLQVYPNPIKNTCNVSFNLDKEGFVKIKLIDLSGRIVYDKRELIKKGKHLTVLNIALPTGTYILHLSTNDKSERTILIKQ